MKHSRISLYDANGKQFCFLPGFPQTRNQPTLSESICMCPKSVLLSYHSHSTSYHGRSSHFHFDPKYFKLYTYFCTWLVIFSHHTILTNNRFIADLLHGFSTTYFSRFKSFTEPFAVHAFACLAHSTHCMHFLINYP